MTSPEESGVRLETEVSEGSKQFYNSSVISEASDKDNADSTCVHSDLSFPVRVHTSEIRTLFFSSPVLAHITPLFFPHLM